jgi:hypothetical protein
VVNAAFNRGNSGGPLLLTETGEVIGVVDSKLAPFGPWATAALQTLEKSNSDTFKFTAQMSDGSTQTYSYSQAIAMVLDELRNQVQLVIGNAVMVGDIRDYLVRNKIDP